MGRACSLGALYRIVRARNLSWKKGQKVLGKADPQRRAAFVEAFRGLFARLCRQEIRLLYIDEAHVHRDMGLRHAQPGLHLGACREARLASERLWLLG